MNSVTFPNSYQLKDLADFHKGKGLPKSEIAYNGQYKCIHYGELFTHYKAVIKAIVSSTNLFNSPVVSKAGDVLMPTSDVTPTGLARASAIEESNVILGGDILVIRPNARLISGNYLSYFLNFCKSDILKRVSGTTVFHLYSSSIADLNIFVPTREEQQRIVEILAEIDEQIESTERLIEKKSLIRNGISLEEFNPRVFKTFTELGLIGEISGGKRLPNGEGYSPVNTLYKYLRVTDFFGKKFVNHSGLQSLREDTFNVLRRYLIEDGDIYISIAGSIGYTGVFAETGMHKTILTENAAKIRLSEMNILPNFVSEYLNSIYGQKDIWDKIGVGGGVPKLALERIAKLSIPIETIENQRKILALLGPVNFEIELLNQELDKLQLQKQGLMQDLLTGRVRVHQL